MNLYIFETPSTRRIQRDMFRARKIILKNREFFIAKLRKFHVSKRDVERIRIEDCLLWYSIVLNDKLKQHQQTLSLTAWKNKEVHGVKNKNKIVRKTIM